MVIAVNTPFLTNEAADNYGFLKELWQRLPQQYPQHQFYFLLNGPYPPPAALPANVQLLVTGPRARHPLLLKYWLDVQVPLLLKKIGAAVFVAPDGMASLTTRLPQCLLLPHHLLQPGSATFSKTHALFFKHYVPRFLKKAAAVGVFSEADKGETTHLFKTDPQKITVVPPAAHEAFTPLLWEKQAVLKEKYTEGKEYFIYTGALQPQLVNLLKAFSFFKKRQQSSMKLVLAGPAAPTGTAFVEQLKTYKYRQDVVLLQEQPEAEKINLLRAAYALVHPFENSMVPVLQAMQSAVPVVTASSAAQQEVAAEATLYFDPAQVADMAEKLMLIYKDENLRSQLIEKGKALSLQYNWQKTTAAVWQCIAAAVKP